MAKSVTEKKPKNKSTDDSFSFTVSRAIDTGRGALGGLTPNGSYIPVVVSKEPNLGSLGSFNNLNNPVECVEAANFASSNPKSTTGDGAFIPLGCDRLSLRYSITFKRPKHIMADGGALITVDTVNKALETDTYSMELAKRYFWNMVNGRTLWRNRISGDVETILRSNNVKIDGVTWPVKINFSKDDISHYVDGYESEMSAFTTNEKGEEKALGVEFFHKIFEVISDALRGKRMVAIFGVDNIIPTMEGLPVYPSQEFLENKDGKVLYSIDDDGIRHAGLHSQKIGNAIRTIDDWYGAEGEDVAVTSVEFFGYNKGLGVALRHTPGKTREHQNSCIYYYTSPEKASELNKVVNGEQKETKQDRKDILYILGVMCRGGILTTVKAS